MGESHSRYKCAVGSGIIQRLDIKRAWYRGRLFEFALACLHASCFIVSPLSIYIYIYICIYLSLFLSPVKTMEGSFALGFGHNMAVAAEPENTIAIALAALATARILLPVGRRLAWHLWDIAKGGWQKVDADEVGISEKLATTLQQQQQR